MSLGVGLRWWTGYEAAPGVVAPAPVVRPADNRLGLALDRPTLLVFVHPYCPCSPSSVAALKSLIERAPRDGPNHLDVRVVIVAAPGLPPGWEKAAVVRAVAGLDVKTYVDDGAVAAEYSASTSGEALFYDAAGALRFQGGLTPRRGHAEAGPGVEAVLALLNGCVPAVSVAPVYGCPLADQRNE